MLSTFHALETARRAMMTQQYALHTTGHNIANANTEGYTRQRVNFEQTESFPGVGKNSPSVPGNLGTGVQAGSIQRVRENFLDVQYRNENNKAGYWNARLDAYEKMEDLLNEPSEQGLNHQINMFWTSLQDLTADPEDAGARSVVRQRAVAVAETFNYLHDSLTTVQGDYKNEIEVTQKEVNSILTQLNSINDQIRKTEPHGYVTNDLYDQQDRLLDQLSRIVNIQVEREPSGGKTNPVAEGAVNVYLINDQGGRYIEEGSDPPQALKLVDGTGQQPPYQMDVKIGRDDLHVSQFSFTKESTDAPGGKVTSVKLTEMPRGEMKALIEAFGYEIQVEDEEGNESSQILGLYPDMLRELNEMATVFANEMNNINKIGYTLASNQAPASVGQELFTFTDGNAAQSIKLSDSVRNSLNNIAASSVNVNALTPEAKERYEELISKNQKTDADYNEIHDLLKLDTNYLPNVTRSFAGDGSNAKRLADIKDTILSFSNDTATISTYYQSVIGDMAVNTQEARRMLSSSESLKDSVDFRRQSVSNVSLDEEMTMMIQFQHAYNAAARNITMVDEMLDRIINGMGVVGR